ncbi:MAG: VCBS repeat-containing protein [Verrucomicrobiales bacterium]
MNFDNRFMDADLNGDGYDETLFREVRRSGDTGDLMLMVRDRSGDGSLFREVSMASNEEKKSGCIADVDGDGMLDVVWVESNGNGLRWRRHLGNLNFAPVETLTMLEPGIGPEGIVNGDFNGDGLQEFLIKLNSGTLVAVRNPDGVWETASVQNVGFPRTFDLAQVADITGDGKDDLLQPGGYSAGNNSARMSVMRQVGSAAAGSVYCTAFDFDSDGDLDLLATNPDRSKLVWLLNDGKGLFPEEDDVFVGDVSFIDSAVVMDADRDGLPDVVVNSRLDGLVLLRRLPPGGSAVARLTAQPDFLSEPGTVDLEWSVLGKSVVEISPAPGLVVAQGAATVTVSETTVFRLDGAEVTVRVSPFHTRHPGGALFPSTPYYPPGNVPIDIDGDGMAELLWVTGGENVDDRSLVALTPRLDGKWKAGSLVTGQPGSWAGCCRVSRILIPMACLMFSFDMRIPGSG